MNVLENDSINKHTKKIQKYSEGKSQILIHQQKFDET